MENSGRAVVGKGVLSIDTNFHVTTPLRGTHFGDGLGKAERDRIRLCKFLDWQMVNFLSINPPLP